MSTSNILPEFILRKILNTCYFKVNADFITNAEDISEYEIQYSFYDVLKNYLRNKGCIVKKERRNVDISITNGEETIKYYFEVKSFIKNHERISIKAINKDINALELFLNEKDNFEKRAFVLLAIREKTIQKSKAKNTELANYLNHKSKEITLQLSKGFMHKIMSSYVIAHNASIEKKYNWHQVRLFLIEIVKI